MATKSGSTRNSAVSQLMAACKKYEDTKLHIDEHGITIYWQCLCVNCDAESFDKAITAVRALQELSAYFE